MGKQHYSINSNCIMAKHMVHVARLHEAKPIYFKMTSGLIASITDFNIFLMIFCCCCCFLILECQVSGGKRRTGRATERQGGTFTCDPSREEWTPKVCRLPKDCCVKGIHDKIQLYFI